MTWQAGCSPVRRKLHYPAHAALLAAVVTLTGCSSTIAGLPSPIGLPAGAPARPATAPAYPTVHEMPPPRTDVVLTEAERKQMERELASARDRQKAEAAKLPPLSPEPVSTQTTGSTPKP